MIWSAERVKEERLCYFTVGLGFGGGLCGTGIKRRVALLLSSLANRRSFFSPRSWADRDVTTTTVLTILFSPWDLYSSSIFFPAGKQYTE